MEAAGLAIGVAGLASLFGSCVRAWGFISASRSFSQEFALQQTKLDIEKTLFLQWGCRTGIITAEGDEAAVIDPRICDDSPRVQTAVINILLAMKKLLTDSEELRLKYDISTFEIAGNADDNNEDEEVTRGNRVSGSMMRAFEDWQHRVQQHQDNTSTWRKTRWVCRDRDRFITFVTEMNFFNVKLEALTPPVHFVQHALIQHIVDGLRADLATLRLVRDASATSRLDWSDAASEQILRSEPGGYSVAGSTVHDEFEHIRRWQQEPADNARQRQTVSMIPIPDDTLQIIQDVANRCPALNGVLKTRANPYVVDLGRTEALETAKLDLQLQRSKLQGVILPLAKLDIFKDCLVDWAGQMSRLEERVRGMAENTGFWSRFLDAFPADYTHQVEEMSDIRRQILRLNSNLLSITTRFYDDQWQASSL